ncbi:MAG TPA: hypothetical protein VGZ29_04055 [Terriglobia bacterium]|nr:hypothetical protein [Terriglobia bacterium]
MSDRARVPILEIIILLVIALIVFFPVISQILPSAPSLPLLERQRAAENRTKVWVNLHSGFYYCAGSTLYGRQKPGKFMAQPEARERGYSPAQQKPCP